MSWILRRAHALVRDDGVMSVALGAAVALSLVGVATGLAHIVVGPFRDWSVIAVPALELALVIAAVALVRPRTG